MDQEGREEEASPTEQAHRQQAQWRLDGAKPRASLKECSLHLLLGSNSGGSTGQRLRLFDADVHVEASAAAVRTRHQSGRSRDVCAAEGVWDAGAAMAAMRSLPGDTLVCDAVLDQGVLPGGATS
ncbi:hypothetical protein FOA52_004962 [Chlamydomonas sp. UWO 241]|nr:hypothetical protein FOA52_004962 [Chlamydomonas sp. UWO 241]